MSAGSVAEGIRAYEDAKLRQAWGILGPLAADGDPLAQFYLGSLHDFTMFDGCDPALAVEWFQRAAAQGDNQARVAAARISLREGLKQPPAIAAGLSKLVADGDRAAAAITASALLPTVDTAALQSLDDPANPLVGAIALLDDSADSLALLGDFHQRVQARLERAFRQSPQHLTAGPAVAPTRAKAVTAFHGAAEQGHPGAQRALATLLDPGPTGASTDSGFWRSLTEPIPPASTDCYSIAPNAWPNDYDMLRIDAWYAEKFRDPASRLTRAVQWCMGEPEWLFWPCRACSFDHDCACRFEHKPEHTPDFRLTRAYDICRASFWDLG